MGNKKPLIYDQKYAELEIQMEQLGQPSFRAKQIFVALYQSMRLSPEEITTLPKDLRSKLGELYRFEALTPVRSIESKDHRTIKTLFKLEDDVPVEAVLMYYDNRRSLCISSQSGCGVGCLFCATGQMGLKRNLSSGEIVAQVLYFERMLANDDDHITNVVVMGMGEPFHNYTNVLEGLNRLNNPLGFNFGARRITLSTVGIVPKIIEFADAETQYNLAISLHTVDDTLRNKLIPINKKYPVDQILSACKYYINRTSRRVTFEYALIDGVNDSQNDAEALAKKIRGMICHVNLIPLNPIESFGGQPSSHERANSFCKILESKNISCSVRLRRGIEIKAGCGQLAAELNQAI